MNKIELTGWDISLRNIVDVVEVGDDIQYHYTSKGSRGFSDHEGEKNGIVSNITDYKISFENGDYLKKSGIDVKYVHTWEDNGVQKNWTHPAPDKILVKKDK